MRREPAWNRGWFFFLALKRFIVRLTCYIMNVCVKVVNYFGGNNNE